MTVDKNCLICGEKYNCPEKYANRCIYCSDRCASKAYSIRNPERRKASIRKYEQNPANKEKKRILSRKSKLRKYGLSIETFKQQLERQNYACYGCLKPINFLSARNDHNHQTGKFRGILCDGCNWALGQAKDNPAILRRLMAYLDYPQDKINIYISGALKNPRIPEIGNLLRREGYDVMDEWFTPGEFADTNWQAYEKLRGRTYTEALKGRAATNIFLFDRVYLDHSDIVLTVMPAGKSSMIELGYAKGRGKHTILFLDGNEPEKYEIMPNIADSIFNTEEELISGLKELQK